MKTIKIAIIIFVIFLLPGCAAVPFGIGLIPGAPAYISSIIGNGQSAYETAVDERSTQQQMLDSIIEGHAQAELYKNKEIRSDQITTYCYFGKLYLVGEYDSQDQLKKIYECVDKVEGKRAVISRLYLKDEQAKQGFFSRQEMIMKVKAQLMADFEVTSSPLNIEIVQGDIILLGVISDKQERDRILAHALKTEGVGRVISYLYHQENAGPEPRIMTAELTPAPSAVSPLPPKRKPSVKKPRPSGKKKSKPKQHVVAVSNPDRGR